MKQLKSWVVLWCVLFPVLVSAQTLTVVDQSTQEPLYMVSIGSPQLNASATTNDEGRADVSKLKGAEDIQIKYIGFESISTSFSELEENEFRVQMRQRAISLNQVVVSATRWRQETSDIPSKIVQISAEQVALQNPQTAADLLGSSGNVFIQKSQQGGGSPMIRGFSTNRLIYTVDGVRMNTAIFRGGNIQNVISLDPFAIENTEVLFGPGSVIYGSDAVGGVMSFQTLTPQLSTTDDPEVSGKAVARYASANSEKTGHFDVNVGWEKWAMTTSISSFDFDHLRQGAHGPDDYIKPFYVERQDSTDVVITQEDSLLQIPSAYSQINLMQRIRFKPNENWDFQYGFHYSETSGYGRYDRHNRRSNGTARYAEWNYGPQKWMMNNLSITHEASNGAYNQVTLRLAHQLFKESRIERSFNSSNRTIRSEEVQAYSANLDFVKSLGEKNTLYYGVEYVLNDVQSSGIDKDISTGMEMRGPARYPRASWQSIGIYVNDEFQVSEKFTLQGGLRYNQFVLDADFDTTFYPFPFTEANLNSGALTGSLGGVYRPTETWAIKANFGTAFRSPNVDDIGKVFDSEPGSVVIPNPGLQAEYAYNIDVGIAKVFGDAIKLDVTGYYTILQNALVRRDFTLNGQDSIVYDGTLSQVQAIQNAAEAVVYGIQAGLEIKLPSGFGFFSDFNFQLGEEELDDGSTSPSRHAAPMYGITRLTYKKKKLNLQLYAVYQGERIHSKLAVDEQRKTEIYALNENGNTYSPAWYTLNLKGMYKINDHFTVSVGLENLTNQRYRPFSSGLSGAGRNFILSFTAHF